MNKIENIIANIVGLISVPFIAWVLISWIEVVAFNTEPAHIYNTWNFFNLFF